MALPPKVNQSDINATSALVRWNPPQDPNGLIIGYRVRYSVVSSDPGVPSTQVMTECIIGGEDYISRNVSVGNVTMVRLSGLSK